MLLLSRPPGKGKFIGDATRQPSSSGRFSPIAEAVNEPELIISGLTTSSRLSEETGHPGRGIRPCIATLSEAQLRKGDFPNRNEAAVILACKGRSKSVPSGGGKVYHPGSRIAL